MLFVSRENGIVVRSGNVRIRKWGQGLFGQEMGTGLVRSGNGDRALFPLFLDGE